MNPLHSFIVNERLFKSVDNEGISVKQNDPLRNLIQRLLRQSVEVTISGEPIAVDRKSAEAFFKRNAQRYQGIVSEDMPLEEKIRIVGTHLRKVQSKGTALPKGVSSVAGVQRELIGTYKEYQFLLHELQANGFLCSSLRQELAARKNERFIHVDREKLFEELCRENADRLNELSSSNAREEVNELSEEVLMRMK